MAARVAAANYVLTPTVVTELLALLRDRPCEGAATAPPSSLKPQSTEFLLLIDASGSPHPFPVEPQQTLEPALDASTGSPDAWLRTIKVAGTPSLLAARWLCHRLGLRHRTVQLILDHPTHPGYTLIQLRGFDNADAPGAFDIACAGHIVGLASVEASLEKELAEELGLRVDDLAELRQLARYEYRELDPPSHFLNVELRAVYRARVKAGSLGRVRFADGEVAGRARGWGKGN